MGGVFDWGLASLVMARGVLTFIDALDRGTPEPGEDRERAMDHCKPLSRPSRARVSLREKVLGWWPSIQNRTEVARLCRVSSPSVGVEVAVYVSVSISLRMFESRSCTISS